MSENEERISVAELLKRNGAALDKPARGSRRRHRGGADSLSVAELTGEFARITDDTPAPAKPVAPANEDAAAESAPLAPADHAGTDVEQPPLDAADGTAPAPEVVEPAPHEAGPAPQEAGPAPQEAGTAAPRTAAEAARAAQDDRRLSFDSGPDTDPNSRVGEAVAERIAAERTAAERTAGSIPNIEQLGSPMATADFNSSQVRARIEQEEQKDRAAAEEARAAAELAAGDLTSDQDDAATDLLARVDSSRVDLADKDAVNDGADRDEVGDDGAAAGPDSLRAWAILGGEAILGLALGAGIFWGFVQLWEWNKLFTPILAVAVIIALVAGVHALRNRVLDLLSLGLAVVVGVFVTFGPLIITLNS